LRRIQALPRLPRHQSRFDQAVEDGLKAQGAQLVVHQTLTEIDQGGGMEGRIAQLPIQRKVPAGMITQHRDGGPIGLAVEKLENAHAHQQQRLNRRSAFLGAVGRRQLRSGLHQAWVDLHRKEPVAVIFRKKAGGQGRGRKQKRLGGELR